MGGWLSPTDEIGQRRKTMLDIEIIPTVDSDYAGSFTDTFTVLVKGGSEFVASVKEIEQKLIEMINQFFAGRHSHRMFRSPTAMFRGEPIELIELGESGTHMFIWNRIPMDLKINPDGFELVMYCPKLSEGDDVLDGTKEWGTDLPPSFWIHPAYTLRRLFMGVQA